MQFQGTWWPFQNAVFAAFERDRERGDTRTSIIAPPGSGKTLMGLEIVRRLISTSQTSQALVLAPNTAIQAQWISECDEHFGKGIAGKTDAKIMVMTYQSLCRFDSEGEVLERMTTARLNKEGREVNAESRAATRRRIRLELARQDPALLIEMLNPDAWSLIQNWTRRGSFVVVADECHHAASMWGYVLDAVITQTKAAHVVGLTATRPSRRASDETELYARLFGEVDIAVDTPAIVREGRLAPYQELAVLVRPLSSERAWLAARDHAYTKLITDLHADTSSALSVPVWAIEQARDTEGWAETAKRQPALADALVQFHRGAGLSIPQPSTVVVTDAEAHDPTEEQWGILLGAWAQDMARREDVDPDKLAKRIAAIQLALDPLGFRITKSGMRRTRAQADRVVCLSAAKALAAVDVVNREQQVRKHELRAIILCDSETSSKDADELRAVIDPASGSARYLQQALFADVRTRGLGASIVTGRNVRVAETDAPRILSALAAHDVKLAALRAKPTDQAGIVEIFGPSEMWNPHSWIQAMTTLLEGGTFNVMLSTRAMLGEGWDAPCVNVLVDCTASATQTTAVQVRGRTLRTDPAHPTKVANNWDIVCVEPGIVGGDRDYRRFVDKHEWLLAPCEDGTIERGVSHVHPSLSTAAPPAKVHLPAITQFALDRAEQLDLIRKRWKVGEGYEAVERLSLTLGPPAARGLSDQQWNQALRAVQQRDMKALYRSVWNRRQRAWLQLALRIPPAKRPSPKGGHQRRPPHGSYPATRIAALALITIALMRYASHHISGPWFELQAAAVLVILGSVAQFVLTHRKEPIRIKSYRPVRVHTYTVMGLTQRLVGWLVAAVATTSVTMSIYSTNGDGPQFAIALLAAIVCGSIFLGYVMLVGIAAIGRLSVAAWVLARHDAAQVGEAAFDVILPDDPWNDGQTLRKTAQSLVLRAVTARPLFPADLICLFVLDANLRSQAIQPSDLDGATFDNRNEYLRFHAPALGGPAPKILGQVSTMLAKGGDTDAVRPAVSPQHVSSDAYSHALPNFITFSPDSAEANAAWKILFSPFARLGISASQTVALRGAKADGPNFIPDQRLPRITEHFIRSSWS